MCRTRCWDFIVGVFLRDGLPRVFGQLRQSAIRRLTPLAPFGVEGVAGMAAESWAVTGTFTPTDITESKLCVSGLPPMAGGSAPFPLLVTIITAG